ncbi:MAG: response regulator [Nitrospina sp.]|jgi:two-component system, NtrC family, sensor kinase|nr:response regulator [Nitrospina sp.]
MEILIAEDNAVSRKLLEKVVVNFGYRVLVAENGRKAWELFQQNRVSMVITDWMMPEMDGIALCKKIRSSSVKNYTYIIVVTAKDQKQDFIEALEAGADDHLSKPFDPDDLKIRIKTGERVVLLEKEHHKLETDLINSRNKLRIVFDSLHEEIVTIDKAMHLVSANRMFLKNRGIAFSEIVTYPYFTEQNGDKLESGVGDVFETGKPQFLADVSLDDNGNKKYREIRFLPAKDGKGEISQVVVVSRDMTESMLKSDKIVLLNAKLRKAFSHVNTKNVKLENTLKELKDTQAQILQSEKMASIGQLAAGVAHEINNPTGFVSSNLKSLLEYQYDINGLLGEYRLLMTGLKEVDLKQDFPPSIARQVGKIISLEEEIDVDLILEDVLELIGESREGTERIKKIVLDLKDFSHPGEDKMQLADINNGIESTLNVVWNELKYKATVTKDYGDLPRIECYPQQLNQVFMNLLVNAAQAIEKEGEIRITTQILDGRVEIKIGDTGSGIPKDNLSKIFDPFFTTKDVGKGTGLGLNMAYNIIKKHNGTIDVESEVGKGTVFTILMPMAPGIDD